jgi:hypothetical protein
METVIALVMKEDRGGPLVGKHKRSLSPWIV